MQNLLQYKIFQSSIDPTQLSNTVRGIFIGSSSLIIFAAATFLHTKLTPDQIVYFADNVAQTISAVGIAVGAIHATYGLVMKVVHFAVNAFTASQVAAPAEQTATA